MKSLIPLLVAIVLSAGCSTTRYKSTTVNAGVTTTTELDARAFLIKRDLGKVTLGNDSLDGSKSDQMTAVSDALGILSRAVKP